MNKIINFDELKNNGTIEVDTRMMKKYCITKKYFSDSKIRFAKYIIHNEDTKIKTTYKNKYHYDKHNRLRVIKAYCNDGKSYKHTIKFKYKNAENYTMSIKHRLFKFKFKIEVRRNKIVKIQNQYFNFIINYDDNNRMIGTKYIQNGIYDFDSIGLYTQFNLLKSVCETMGNTKMNYYKDNIIESMYRDDELIYKNIFENDKLIKQIRDGNEYDVIYNSNTIQIINNKTTKQSIYDSITHDAIYTNNKFNNDIEYEIEKDENTIVDLTNNIYIKKSIDKEQLAIVSMDNFQVLYGYRNYNKDKKIEELYDDSLEIYQGISDEAEKLLSLNLDKELEYNEFYEILIATLKVYLI